MIRILFATLVIAATSVAATNYPEPKATFEASKFTTWNKKRVGKSKLAEIEVTFTSYENPSEQDSIKMKRLDLVGDSRERGYAHGFLLARDIVVFTGPQMDQFFMDEVLQLDISSFPEPLQKILRVIQVKGAIVAPEVFRQALGWVWEKEVSYVPQYLIDEIDGMAAGICDGLRGQEECDVSAWSLKLKQINMLPELIRMACTAYGAWGKATPANQLIQLRALDFGSGPWASNTLVAVHRDPSKNNAFVSVSFPGFVGAITGISQRGIGISEKVWMTYDKRELQPGSYNGESDVFILRDILELTSTKAEAEVYLQNAKRTWGIWIGIGDYTTNTFDLVGYKQDSVVAYTDITAPSMTGQPYLESIAYVDKHPQPSHDGPTGTLPTALTDFYGNITCESSKTIALYHQTGDVHIATYDYSQGLMYLAIGRTNAKGQYGPSDGTNFDVWKAYNRPYVKFSLNDLWGGH
eukprot:gene6963-9518_t